MTSRRRPVLLSWSGGKDSTLALAALREDPAVELAALVTTVRGSDRVVSSHGVGVDLLERQAEALGLPLEVETLPVRPGNGEYEAAVGRLVEPFRRQGVLEIAYGDLFLEDMRAYREGVGERTGVRATFPLWGRETRGLARYFIESGFRAVVTAVNPDRLDPSFTGRAYDEAFLEALPDDVDPCGENGEFHTYVWDGPPFSRPVPVDVLEVEAGERYVFARIRGRARG